MADDAKTDVATNRCDVDAVASEKLDPTVLTMFAPPIETPDYIERTARYAKQPKAYLQDALGPDFEERKHLLSIPEKIDRDGYGTGTHKQAFETHIAKLMGKPHGLFFITGVQAQLAALKIHCDRAGNSRVAWHATSHLEEAEEQAWKELYGLERRLVGAKEEALASVEEVKEVLQLPKNERPAVLLIELPNRTLGCATYSFAELEEISKACREASVKFHCDGARLWEIEPYYRHTANKSFAEIARLFDTVYVSFYKGLSGYTGAMLLCPDERFLKDAKMWQRRAGGNAFTLVYEVVDCERAFNENIGTFGRKWRKMQEVTGAINAATKEYRTDDGEPIVSFMVDPATCCQGRVIFQGYSAEQFLQARDKVQETTNVRIFNRFWPKQTLDEKLKEEREGTEGSRENENAEKETAVDQKHIIEWMMMNVTEKIATEVMVEAYVELCKSLTNS